MIKIKESRITLFAAFVLLFSCLNISAQVPKKIRTIIVDAGHGGSDVGAKAENEGSMGSYEKNITLAISNKLVAELRKQLPDTKTLSIFRSQNGFDHLDMLTNTDVLKYLVKDLTAIIVNSAKSKSITVK